MKYSLRKGDFRFPFNFELFKKIDPKARVVGDYLYTRADKLYVLPLVYDYVEIVEYLGRSVLYSNSAICFVDRNIEKTRYDVVSLIYSLSDHYVHMFIYYPYFNCVLGILEPFTRFDFSKIVEKVIMYQCVPLFNVCICDRCCMLYNIDNRVLRVDGELNYFKSFLFTDHKYFDKSVILMNTERRKIIEIINLASEHYTYTNVRYIECKDVNDFIVYALSKVSMGTDLLITS